MDSDATAGMLYFELTRTLADLISNPLALDAGARRLARPSRF